MSLAVASADKCNLNFTSLAVSSAKLHGNSKLQKNNVKSSKVDTQTNAEHFLIESKQYSKKKEQSKTGGKKRRKIANTIYSCI